MLASMMFDAYVVVDAILPDYQVSDGGAAEYVCREDVLVVDDVVDFGECAGGGQGGRKGEPHCAVRAVEGD